MGELFPLCQKIRDVTAAHVGHLHASYTKPDIIHEIWQSFLSMVPHSIILSKTFLISFKFCVHVHLINMVLFHSSHAENLE